MTSTNSAGLRGAQGPTCLKEAQKKEQAPPAFKLREPSANDSKPASTTCCALSPEGLRGPEAYELDGRSSWRVGCASAEARELTEDDSPTAIVDRALLKSETLLAEMSKLSFFDGGDAEPLASCFALAAESETLSTTWPRAPSPLATQRGQNVVKVPLELLRMVPDIWAQLRERKAAPASGRSVPPCCSSQALGQAGLELWNSSELLQSEDMSDARTESTCVPMTDSPPLERCMPRAAGAPKEVHATPKFSFAVAPLIVQDQNEILRAQVALPADSALRVPRSKGLLPVAPMLSQQFVLPIYMSPRLSPRLSPGLSPSLSHIRRVNYRIRVTTVTTTTLSTSTSTVCPLVTIFSP